MARSILWEGRVQLGNFDFEANAKKTDGISTGRFAIKIFSKWYDHVESLQASSGSMEGLYLPDGQFLPPMELNCVEKDVSARIKDFIKVQRHLIVGVLPI